MSSETTQITVESNNAGMNYKETELTLGLPGDQSRGLKSGMKRGYSDMVDLKLGSNSEVTDCLVGNSKDDDKSDATKPPKAKGQVVGWPPVRAYRKNIMKSCKYVKVAVDGAPYLRKVDLELYTSYAQLLSALEDMFTSCFTIRNVLNERKLMDVVNGMEYVPTYEDKDGDWMLVGDVPWNMFVETCKRLRLRKSSEAIIVSAPRTPSKCSSSSS